jgi:phosphoglycerate kinase
MAIKYLDQIDLKGKRVFIRVDFNVPYDKNLNITDDTRITSTLPTIKYCIEHAAKTILVSHLGRPNGKPVPEMTLKPTAVRLSEILNKEVTFFDKSLDEAAVYSKSMKDGDVIMLENIRFYPGEEKNDDSLGKQLSNLCDIYVNDAFATAHRGHSSNDAITKYVNICAAGFLLKNELEYSKKALDNPERPFGVIIGGAKVSSKLDALKNIINKVDFLIIGGGMAFTFLKAKGFKTGKSLLEADLVETAKQIIDEASSKKVEILLPVDQIIAAEFNNESSKSTVKIESIPENMMGLDIGPETIKLFSDKIKTAETIIWNGPVGAFEFSNFSAGTFSIAKTLAECSCISIIGGGDTVTAVNQSGLANKMTYISTGGGAFLELLEGKTLPGFASLDK